MKLPARLSGNRLFVRFYLSLLGGLLLFALSIVLLFQLTRDDAHIARQRMAAEQLALDMPQTLSPAQLRRLARQNRAELGIYDAQGKRLLAAGRMPPQLPPPPGWLRQLVGPPQRHVTVALGQGQTLVYRARRKPGTAAPLMTELGFGAGVLLLLVIMGVAAYPLTQRLTRRLERLGEQVTRWGQQGGQLQLSAGELTGNDEIAMLARQLDQASRQIDQLLAAHRLLLAHASHELRTPLTRIRLQLEMIQPLIDPAQQPAYARREQAMTRDLAELNRLIDGLLLSSRLDAGQPVEPVVRLDLAALIAQEMTHYPQVATSLPASAVWLSGQADLLRRLLRNLLDNALRHGAPPVTLHLTNDKQAITLSVCDQGKGIALAQRDRIFEPFIRLDQNVAGSGLGLSLVRKIVQAHGGSIEVTCGPQQTGSCFVVSLPGC